MSKVVINLGYRSFVVDADKALLIAEAVSDAEVYERKYHSRTDVRDSYNTYHIYPATEDTAITMQLITNESYQMYKLAGKPDNT